ncbi:MAG: Smr/MutS family protein [Paracoccaceae bacterium]
MSRRRKLTQDELNLWRRVADTTEKLAPAKADVDLPPEMPKPQIIPTPKTPIPALPQRQKPYAPAISFDLADQLEHRLETAPIRMDHKAFKRMKRGKLKPEGRIDLHGMTLDRAHPALIRFILTSAASGKRLVLVITGKGKDRDDYDPIPTRRGVLRHQVPHWMTIPPLVSHIIQFTPAHISHGGEGAYYVYLKRQR